ncbi:MAG: TIGR04104 family putative zinc finger protein [Bacillota bacterium]
MPICQKCGCSWNWKETFLKILTFKNKLSCPSCKSLQYVSKKSRQRIRLISLLSISMMVPMISMGVRIGYILLFDLILYVLLIACLPFFYILSNEDEPML